MLRSCSSNRKSHLCAINVIDEMESIRSDGLRLRPYINFKVVGEEPSELDDDQ
jgi:hypothetical protein